jgi:ribosome-binding factor A
MNGMSKRQQKFSRQLQKDIGEIFQKEMSSSLRGAFITVTGVETSPDLGVAKVYLSLMMVEDKSQFLDEIKLKTKEIRGILGRKIGKQVRVIPELIFYLDNSAEEGARIEKLINSLHIPPSTDSQ